MGFGFLLWILPALVSAASRHALVYGANEGLASEPVLAFAEKDAERMARIFREVGGMPPERVRLLQGRPLSALKAALSELGREPFEEFWLFVSGHADSRGLHVRGEILPWAELRRTLESLPANRRIGFVDACNSGALLTAKGISFESQLTIRVEPKVQGLALLTSSGSNELSYESRQLSGSPFAHFLASGLRGAADQDRDGQVTLSEVYTYLYARTVAASLGGRQGPQHPAQAGWFQGQGEWVLSRAHLGGGALRLRDERFGQCFVLDREETRVIAEVGPLDPAPVQLAPGRYRIKCLKGVEAYGATVELTGGSSTDVESLGFTPIEREVMLARGPGLKLRRRVALGLGVAVDDPNVLPWASLAWIEDYDAFAFEAQLAASTDGLAATKLAFYGHLPWWTVLHTRLDVGLSAAYQTSFGDAGQFLFGPLLQLSLEPTPRWRLFLRQEILRKVSLSASTSDSLPLLTSAGISFSFDE